MPFLIHFWIQKFYRASFQEDALEVDDHGNQILRDYDSAFAPGKNCKHKRIIIQMFFCITKSKI